MNTKRLDPMILVISLVWLILFSTSLFSQNKPTELILNTPIITEFNKRPAKSFEGQLKELKNLETSKFFTVRLNANQTARIEIEHDGMDIMVFARKPSGERYIAIESPSGKLGKKVLLATAEKDGLYKVEVRPLHPIPRLIKLRVELKKIRKTNENDHFINEVYTKMLQLTRAQKHESTLTIEERREAIKNTKEVLRLSKIVKDKYWEADAYVILGVMHNAIGEIQTSFESWLEARRVYRELNSKYREGQMVGNIGILHKRLGDYERALNYFEVSLNLQKDSLNRYDKAAIFSNIGSTLRLLGQYDEAIKYTEQALDLYKAMRLMRSEAGQAGILGQIYISKGNYKKGIEYLQKSLELGKKSNNRQLLASAKHQLGLAYKDTGRNEEAFELFKQANSLAIELGIRPGIVSTYYRLAEAEKERGNLEKAINHLEEGLKIIEKTRSELKSKDQRTTYFATVQRFYELYVDLLIERSKQNDTPRDIFLAFEMSERSRSRGLVDLLQEARVNFKQGVNVKLLEKEKDLANNLEAKYRTREILLRQKAKQEQIDKIEGEINKLDIELENITLQIKSESPQYANLARGKILSTKEIQNLLDHETVLLEYKLGKKQSHLWLVTKDSIKHFTLPNAEKIEMEARIFYDATVRNNKNEKEVIQRSSRNLYKILLAGVKNEIKGKRIALVTDGILQYIPFSSLQDTEKKYLADTNEIIILPSASALAQIRNYSPKFTQNNKTIAIFADPVFDKQDSRLSSNKDAVTLSVEMKKVTRDFRFGEVLPRLLASRQEARSISNLLNKNQVFVQTDFSASVKNIEQANLKDYRNLHFATHGLLNTNRPELSGLVFSLYDEKGKSQDGFLSLNDIFNLDLASDMVVLSACQTALGKEVKGEGLIGLSRGFLYAGSKRVVASLWKVDDVATAEFMKRFYKNHLQKGMSASKALQQTKIEMKKIKRYQSPYYWSAFTLLGDWK